MFKSISSIRLRSRGSKFEASLGKKLWENPPQWKKVGYGCTPVISAIVGSLK
jgi:hypothetical protein